MVLNDVDPNAGLITLPENSQLVLKVMKHNLSGEDIEGFIGMHNERWGFHSIDAETFLKRVERGTLIGGFYQSGPDAPYEPVTLLETTAIKLEEIAEIERATIDNRERGYEVAKLLHQRFPRGYLDVTNEGEWHPNEEGANVLLMVDLSTPEKFEGKAFPRPLINYFKMVMLEENGFQRPQELKDVTYIPTFSPKPDDYSGIEHKGGIVAFHNRIGGAFNSGYVWENARPGYNEPDVIAMFYVAPDYVPKLGKNDIQRMGNLVTL